MTDLQILYIIIFRYQYYFGIKATNHNNNKNYNNNGLNVKVNEKKIDNNYYENDLYIDRKMIMINWQLMVIITRNNFMDHVLDD